MLVGFAVVKSVLRRWDSLLGHNLVIVLGSALALRNLKTRIVLRRRFGSEDTVGKISLIDSILVSVVVSKVVFMVFMISIIGGVLVMMAGALLTVVVRPPDVLGHIVHILV